jgi:hypothetical protein
MSIKSNANSIPKIKVRLSLLLLLLYIHMFSYSAAQATDFHSADVYTIVNTCRVTAK